MYASQTKRLCVREAPTDDTRTQHHSSSSSSAETTTDQQQQPSNPPASSASREGALPPTGVTARRSLKTSPVASGSVGAAAGPCGGDDGSAIAIDSGNNNSNSNTSMMTASATGTISGTESELSMKTLLPPNQASPSIQSNHREHSQAPGRAQQHRHQQLPPEDPTTTMNAQNGSNLRSSDSEQQLIDRLANETLKEARLELILSLRNLITACNKKKVSLLNKPNFAKIIWMIDDEGQHTSPEVKAQVALLICSIAKGGEQNVKVLNDYCVDERVFDLILSSQDDALIEACLRCLRAIMSWPKVSRHYMLYDNQPHSSNGPKRIIDYARTSNSYIVQECVADIFDATCNRSKDQMMLFVSGALPCIMQMLEAKSHRVILAALNWLSTMCLMNSTVALEASRSHCPSGQTLLNRLVGLMNKDVCIELQLSSAKCFTRIYKALDPNHLENDPRIVAYVLPTLVRMVHRDKSAQLRAEAATTIASFIEYDINLQKTASICDNLIESLANMLEYESCLMSDIRDYSSQLLQSHYASDKDSFRGPSSSFRCHSPQLLDLSNLESIKPVDFNPTDAKYPECIREMERAAFQALAALASNQETIRKKIFDSCAVMQHLVRGLSATDPRTLKSVLICLLSLSRSVQQLRTNFNDSALYSALKNLLQTSSPDILNLVLMILCNISLDFSPGKQHFLDPPTIEILCNLIRGSDQSLKLHGMWILMNMVYMLENADLKSQILGTLKPSQVVHILENDTDEMLVLKTLGFLRNLLSYRFHIDKFIGDYGNPIMCALRQVLERPCSPKIKEQAICVLTNIADGVISRDVVANNQFILGYLARTIYDEEAGDMRLAAICCITNLAHKDQNGSHSRQNKMKRFGIQDKLKSMLNTKDPVLSDRVRTAYNQFLLGIDDKYVS